MFGYTQGAIAWLVYFLSCRSHTLDTIVHILVFCLQISVRGRATRLYNVFNYTCVVVFLCIGIFVQFIV